jgi:hypothetical protein
MGGEMTREKQLELLLKEAMEFLKARGSYWYNSQRKGIASDLIDRIEKIINDK